MSELNPRLRDEIDDRVAEAFDACLADRLAEPGPLRTAMKRQRRAWIVLGTSALGALVTLVGSPGILVGCCVWLAILVTNVVVLTV
jgi:hypothetical protein